MCNYLEKKMELEQCKLKLKIIRSTQNVKNKHNHDTKWMTCKCFLDQVEDMKLKKEEELKIIMAKEKELWTEGNDIKTAMSKIQNELMHAQLEIDMMIQVSNGGLSSGNPKKRQLQDKDGENESDKEVAPSTPTIGRTIVLQRGMNVTEGGNSDAQTVPQSPSESVE